MLEELTDLLVLWGHVVAYVLACSDGNLSGSGRIADGHPLSGEDCPVDDGLASFVASAGDTTVHVATIPSDDLCRQALQALHRANHKGEAAATPRAAQS
jgi:hypothetical protein